MNIITSIALLAIALIKRSDANACGTDTPTIEPTPAPTQIPSEATITLESSKAGYYFGATAKFYSDSTRSGWTQLGPTLLTMKLAPESGTFTLTAKGTGSINVALCPFCSIPHDQIAFVWGSPFAFKSSNLGDNQITLEDGNGNCLTQCTGCFPNVKSGDSDPIVYRPCTGDAKQIWKVAYL